MQQEDERRKAELEAARKAHFEDKKRLMAKRGETVTAATVVLPKLINSADTVTSTLSSTLIPTLSKTSN